jgi:hypothetical protein
MGHGVMECENPHMIAELAKDITEISPDLYCCVYGCKNIKEHTTEGHFCEFCKKYSHDLSECPERLWNVKMQRSTVFGQSKDEYKEKKYLKIQIRNKLKWQEHMVYTIVYAGMGCQWFARRDNNFEKIELFFMHSDQWGQYGKDTDDREELNKFLEGYRYVDTTNVTAGSTSSVF